MKKLLFSMALAIASFSLHAQSPLFDSLYSLIKARSIHTQDVNWDSIRPLVYQQIDYNKTDSIESFLPAFSTLMKLLKDMHSGLAYKDKYYGNPDAGAYVRRKMDTATYRAAQKGLARLHTQLIQGHYGYICIPEAGIEATEDMQVALHNISKIAQAIADSLCQLQQQPLKGWIVDLRLNGGGSSPALIGGMAALLPEGTAFAFSKNNAPKEVLHFRQGNLYYDATQMTKLTTHCQPAKPLKVAVLISGYTTSAGEHAAIALKSNSQTRYFGSPTRGQITGNETIFLRKDLILHLSSAWAEDSAGRKYTSDVQPDVLITQGYNFNDPNKDSCVQTAIQWLGKKK